MPQIHNVPDIRAGGIESPEYEQARRTHTRILRKKHELETEYEALQAKLAKLGHEDQRVLAERWLAGQGDIPEDSQLGELREEISQLKRRLQTLNELALPKAEGGVLDTVLYHRNDWARQIAREELPVRLEELEDVLVEVQQLVGSKIYRVLSAFAILDWCASGSPGTYSQPMDNVTPAAARPIQETVAYIRGKLAERDDAPLQDAPLEEVSA